MHVNTSVSANRRSTGGSETFCTVEVSSRHSWTMLLLVEVKSPAPLRGVLQRQTASLRRRDRRRRRTGRPESYLSSQASRFLAAAMSSMTAVRNWLEG